MSKVISVNAGSSSLKFKLFNMPEEEVLVSGICERIGLEDGIFKLEFNDTKHKEIIDIPNHEVAVSLLLEALIKFGIVESLEEIVGAGHRVVQGGDVFKESVSVDQFAIEKVTEFIELAPLHNRANLIGYQAFASKLPHCKHVFVFDTSFHQTMTAESYLYPFPYNYYTDYKVRRYGAHGTSHFYVSHRCAELMGQDIKNLKIITCHLGNGASISAIDGGKVINTSMGFTPLAGLMMGTRTGDVDPSAVLYMMEKLNLSPSEMNHVLNKQSGMLGVSGISSDCRDIEDAIAEGNERARLTMDIYNNRLVNVIGGYYAQLGGLDAIVFTGGIGENATDVRAELMQSLEKILDVKFDYQLNSKLRAKEALLSDPSAKVKCYLIPTDEELVIARDTVRIHGL